MIKSLKLVISALLFLCLMDMPYGYYEFVRFISMVGFAFLAYEAGKGSREKEVIIYVALALLFQPFFKIALGRGMWNVVDVVVGVGLLISLIPQRKRA